MELDLTRRPLISFVDPTHIQKRPPTPLDPYLSDILTTVGSRFKRDQRFHPDLVDLSTGLGSTFDEKDCPEAESSAFVLVGSVGIGKTSFLRWWTHQEQRSSVSVSFEIDHEGTSYAATEPIDRFIAQQISKELNRKLSLNTKFLSEFDKLLDTLKVEIGATGEKNFRSRFLNQAPSFQADFSMLSADVLLTTLIVAANRTLGRPVWLVVDNVDLETPKRQNEFIRGSLALFHAICENAADRRWTTRVHLVIAARPETLGRYQHYCADYQCFEYPKPDIREIALRRFALALRAALPDGPLNFALTAGGRTFNMKQELRQHLEECHRKSIALDRWPWADYPPTDWHLSLVNRNVRRFVTAWTHLLRSANFYDWAFADTDEPLKSPTPYQYLRLLIRGPYFEFAGNGKLDGSGYSADSPLFFNVYGTPLRPGMSVADYCRQHMIYVRILQYLEALDGTVTFGTLLTDLGRFFTTDQLTAATKLLVWLRIIDESKYGARCIGEKAHWRDIELAMDAPLSSADPARMYLANLMYEYEYTSSMAVVSYHLENIHSRPM